MLFRSPDPETLWIGEMIKEGESRYQNWQRKIQSLSYVFKEESETLFSENKFDDVFDDLTDYEVYEEEPNLLLEEDEGFYISHLDDVYEILAFTTVDTSIVEGAVKRTVAVRGGKRKVIFKCGPGQMKIGRSCKIDTVDCLSFYYDPGTS